MGEQQFDGDENPGDIHACVSSPLRDMAMVRSTLAPEAVLEAVRREYRIDRVEECILIRTFVNDVYLLMERLRARIHRDPSAQQR